mmetsp:Transcript_17382/g.43694  ORF Transcript_17382/g.43694 Transcript_17382/m.43694 type:complete len:112 (-) Transcript_17382:19-354(-)
MLASVTLRASLTTIGESAFARCHSLQTVKLLDGLGVIGAHAFESCSMLASVTLRASLTTIGESAFAQCHALPTVTLPDGREERAVASNANDSWWASKDTCRRSILAPGVSK